MIEDFERCYRAVESRDSRFDGWLYIGVTSTGIYCRPSCPANMPKRQNVRFFRNAAAAQAEGFRACRRCRPDASPGSPEWDVRADLVGRAMRLIADGVVDREGVQGLASRLGYSERQLNRQLVAEVGAGPLSIARSRRAQTARILIETTSLAMADVALASGFSSVRQFNDVVRAVFASTPTDLRRAHRSNGTSSPGTISVRLPFRTPFAADALIEFLALRAVPGVEEVRDETYRRTLTLPNGFAVVELEPRGDHVACRLKLEDLRDLSTAVQRCRRFLDLDSDPLAIAEVLSADRHLRPSVRKTPGRRVPGALDPHELALRAVLGQQVSVAGARTAAARLVAGLGRPLPEPDGGLTRLWPGPQEVAEGDLSILKMPGRRRETVRSLARALATGEIELDAGARWEDVAETLRSLPGIGHWTAGYIRMRALGDPDAFLPTDLGARRGAEALGLTATPALLERHSARWRPWRAYALQHLWAA